MYLYFTKLDALKAKTQKFFFVTNCTNLFWNADILTPDYIFFYFY